MKGLGFWRSYGDQESSIKGNIHPNDYKVFERNLNTEFCPLIVDEKKKVLDFYRCRHLRYVIKLFAKGKITKGRKTLRELQFKPNEMFKAL